MNGKDKRELACLRQCRVARYLSDKNVFIGGCPCFGPNDCRFNLKSDLPRSWFEDNRVFIQQLSTE